MIYLFPNYINYLSLVYLSKHLKHIGEKMSKLSKVLAVLIASLAFTNASAESNSEWKAEIVPYVWAAGLDADVNVGNRHADVDVGFSDLFDSVDMAGSFLTSIRKDRMVIWGQFDYVGLDTDKLDNAPARGRVESETIFTTVALGYEFNGPFENSTIDVLAGLRYTGIDNEISFDGLGSAKGDKDLFDGVIVVRPYVPLTDTIAFNPTMSIGTGDSEFTYELQPQLQFQINETLVARVGYRRLYYDINGDRTGFQGSFHGFILGLGAQF